MAVLLDLCRRTAEPSLVIKWNGMPASFRWRGEMHETAVLHSWWEDGAGRQWYRVESVEGRLFLLGCGRDGWTAAPLPGGAGPASGQAARA
ncbi:MAG: hypothetical protein ACOY93_07130 [Bacillota bacterium]